MPDFDLIAPGAGILALFGVVGLVVQAIRQGRAIRRLEERLREGGVSAAEASLERLRALQTRADISTGVPRGPRWRPGPGLVAGAVAVVLLAGGWFAFLRDADDSASADGAGTSTAQTTTGTSTPTTTAPSDRVPAEVPPLASKAQFTIAVLNASGISGAAARLQGALLSEGYSGGLVGDSPDGRTDLPRSVVLWTSGRRDVGLNVAKDLGITRARLLDGITPTQIESADAVVLVGLDVGNG